MFLPHTAATTYERPTVCRSMSMELSQSDYALVSFCCCSVEVYKHALQLPVSSVGPYLAASLVHLFAIAPQRTMMYVETVVYLLLLALFCGLACVLNKCRTVRAKRLFLACLCFAVLRYFYCSIQSIKSYCKNTSISPSDVPFYWHELLCYATGCRDPTRNSWCNVLACRDFTADMSGPRTCIKQCVTHQIIRMICVMIYITILMLQRCFPNKVVGNANPPANQAGLPANAAVQHTCGWLPLAWVFYHDCLCHVFGATKVSVECGDTVLHRAGVFGTMKWNWVRIFFYQHTPEYHILSAVAGEKIINMFHPSVITLGVMIGFLKGKKHLLDDKPIIDNWLWRYVLVLVLSAFLSVDVYIICASFVERYLYPSFDALYCKIFASLIGVGTQAFFYEIMRHNVVTTCVNAHIAECMLYVTSIILIPLLGVHYDPFVSFASLLHALANLHSDMQRAQAKKQREQTGGGREEQDQQARGGNRARAPRRPA